MPGELPQVAAAEAFLRAWSWRDWTAMHAALQVRRRDRRSPAQLRELFGEKQLISYRLMGVRETSHATNLVTEDGPVGALLPEMVTVGAFATYRSGKRTRRVTLMLNVVKEGPDGNPSPTGEWGVNETSALRETFVPR